VHPRNYLATNHPFPLGRPLYENPVKNLMMLGARNLGKSFQVSGLISHTFLFDGSKHYTNESIQNPSPAEILVGAAKSDRSTEILKKVKEALDLLPGKQVISSMTYPCPFKKTYKGT
jgi:hypothetical protein